MNTIDSYRFGLIVVNGKKYTSDVVISPDGVRSDWWRKKGHELCPADITDILNEKPEVLIVGTGAYGLMKVLPEAEQLAKARGTQLIAEPTNEAYNTYNQLCHSQRAVAALHLTC